MELTVDLTKTTQRVVGHPKMIRKVSDLPLTSAKTGTNWHELMVWTGATTC